MEHAVIKLQEVLSHHADELDLRRAPGKEGST